LVGGTKACGVWPSVGTSCEGSISIIDADKDEHGLKAAVGAFAASPATTC